MLLLVRFSFLKTHLVEGLLIALRLCNMLPEPAAPYVSSHSPGVCNNRRTGNVYEGDFFTDQENLTAEPKSSVGTSVLIPDPTPRARSVHTRRQIARCNIDL